VKEIAPGWPLVVEETTENHHIVTTGDLVLLFAYHGSSSDVWHVEATVRVIKRMNRQRKERVRFLFVFPETAAPPPSAAVRDAIISAGKDAEKIVSRACAVMPHTGFGAAIHRAVVTGVVALARWPVPHLITSDLHKGLAYLLAPDEVLLAPLSQLCAERRQGPPPG
jgi:hypothetical protein